MDLFHYFTFLKGAFLTEKLIYLTIVYVENRSLLCDHTSFEYHTSLKVFLIFRVMQIKMKATYSREEKRQQNHWKMEIKK